MGIERFLPPNDLLQYTTEAEPWAQYRLENGVIIRAKITLAKVVSPAGQFTPDGFPVLSMDWGTIVNFTYPPHLLEEAAKRRAG